MNGHFTETETWKGHELEKENRTQKDENICIHYETFKQINIVLNFLLKKLRDESFQMAEI